VNTAFSVLFLLRSTKKAIERAKSYGDGSLLAGRGLPNEIQEVRVRGGQVAAKKIASPTSELVDILSKADHSQFAAVAADPDLLRDRIKAASADERKEYLNRLRALAATGVPDARVTAVRVLSTLRDLDSCPALIAALDDPNWQVVMAADEGLRFMGWKTGVAALGDKPDDKGRAAAKDRWKQWYLTVRPDAELE
jgi:HEAT repeat protein